MAPPRNSEKERSSKSSSDGRYVLTCTFKVGANLDLANVDINNRVNKATAKLPAEAINYGISVKKKSPDILLAISVYSPDGTFDDTFLSNFTSINLVDPIARTPGVGSTMIVGQRDYAMHFWVRPDKLAKLGLTGSDLSSVIGEQNLVAPAGQVGQRQVGGDRGLDDFQNRVLSAMRLGFGGHVEKK